MKICLTANTAWNLAHFRLNHLIALRDAGVEVHAVAPPDAYVSTLTDNGIHFHPWKIERRSLNPGREFVSVRRIQKIYASIQPDLVHHYTVKAVLYGTTAARLNRTKAIVNSVTGLPYIIVSPKKGLAKQLARSVAMRWYAWAVKGKNTHVILQNQDDLDLLETFSGSLQNSATITNGSGVDLKRFQLKPQPENRPVHIVFVGRFLREKGIFELMQAAREMRREGVNFKLTLCGDIDTGNLSSATSDHCLQWKNDNLVDQMGRVDDVRPYLESADIVVLPSYREGTPRSLLEAMAIGRPLVATDVPGCRNVVEDGVNGHLIPAKSSRELANALTHLIENPQLRETMGAASRKKAVTDFDEKTVIAQTMQVYAGLQPERMPTVETEKTADRPLVEQDSGALPAAT